MSPRFIVFLSRKLYLTVLIYYHLSSPKILKKYIGYLHAYREVQVFVYKVKLVLE